jgi:hypothetical protein
MKDLTKFTKEQIYAFILGVTECTERGDTIDKRKELEWTIAGGDVRWHIKAQWVKAVTRYPKSNPMTDRDDIYHYDDFYFSISPSDSPRKFCSEICDAIDYINMNEFNEN